MVEASCILEEFTRNTQLRPRRIGINAPIFDLKEKLQVKGFFHPKNGRPQGISSMVSMLDDAEIITAFNSVIRGMLNYYQIADNLSAIKALMVQLKMSCSCTLARKHNKPMR